MKKMSREENDKINIYPITVGVLEHKYLKKLFKESYNSKFKVVPEPIPCIQLDNRKKCKATYLNTNIQAIKNRLENSDANISKNDIIILITDKDSASLEMIKEFKKKFHSLFKEYDHHFFILNVKQFEYWLRHYYDYSFEDLSGKNTGRIKSEMSQDISEWGTPFLKKHKNAKNKYNKEIGSTYEKETCFSITEGISDYTKIKKEYSDFPCFFDKLKVSFKIEM